MYANATGFNPQHSLLGGLSTKGNVGAFAKGQAYQSGAGMNMEREKQYQQFGLEQMNQQHDLRTQQNQLSAHRAGHQTEEQLATEGLQNRKDVFNTGMQYDYAQMYKQRHMQLLNSLIAHSAREF
jgi:hypothetical protein